MKTPLHVVAQPVLEHLAALWRSFLHRSWLSSTMILRRLSLVWAFVLLLAMGGLAAQLAPAAPAASVPGPVPLPDDPAATAVDRDFMKRAHALAASAARHGNTAFSAILVKDGKVVMEFENDALTTHDVTHHAETGLISVASVKLGAAVFAGSTLYASSEPCLMCCGAIRTAGIARLVYGVTGTQGQLSGRQLPNPLQCREIFARLGSPITVVGPVLEAEGLVVRAAALKPAGAK
jgi:tRNA(Arg) A34 adenosine deaminase TadA